MQKRNPFQFKKFTIQQENVAMPVTTDACIFGAYCELSNCKKVLDIGAGTGLLSFMLAQRFAELEITALEVHEPSFETLQKNIQSSIFKENITAVLGDILNWNPKEKYDAIIWNPPFFENQLHSESDSKKLARHTESLSYQDFPLILLRLLSANGIAWLLIPDIHLPKISNLLSKNGLKLLKKISIQSNADKLIHLWILKVGSTGKAEQDEALITYKSPGAYNAEMHQLLGPFYLAL